MSSKDDDRRLFEHFVIAGLSQEAPEQATPSSQEFGFRNSSPLAPITDICVIFPSLGETAPEGYEIIETTQLGYPADLNHGSIRMPSVFLCYRRGYHKPPLLDIGLIEYGRGEKPMVDTNIVQTTPFGRPANVNNASQNIFLTYRRAVPSSAPSQFVVTDICVILANKGEIPLHTYYKIPKNLNKGMVGSDVYICYKKSQCSTKRLAYKPSVLDYFPKAKSGDSNDDDFKLAQNISLFCLPMGALIECWPVKCQPPDRVFSTFVLTDENGTKFYGASVSFFEKYDEKLSDEQLEQLELNSTGRVDEAGAVEDSSSNNDPADEMTFYTNIAICIISRYPFFNSFKRFLYYIHRMSIGGGVHAVPIERYISHLMFEVSFPTPRRPYVLMQLGSETISFDSYDESQLPLNGAQLCDTLRALGTDNLIYLMMLALLEQKILVHSLRSWMLTAVAESVCALMFPFHWQCPYVPQCPLGLAGVLHAPLPFIAGVDSRYFDLYEDPPPDVTCFDLDTATISQSLNRQTLKLSILPKKPTKQLKATLDDLFRRLNKEAFDLGAKADYVPVDREMVIQKKRKELEMAIHDAFLRFMANLMRGYQSFLKPIKCAPASVSATDTGNLFDLDGFLKSRDKSGVEFFRRFGATQSFIRFIEERSFISDKSTYNAFFDDCIAKVDMSEGNDVPLLESDSSAHLNNTSVFIAPPEPIIDPATGLEREFRYERFPRRLDPALFQLDQLNLNRTTDQHTVPVQYEHNRCAAVRTKPEMKSSILAATNSVRTNPLHWPKTLLFYAYSLWFMQLPSLVSIAPNKRKILLLAFHILDRMEHTEVFPLDQVCYRILIELCGECGEPSLAVKVLQAMHRAGVEQNAVTYGIYHRAVLNAKWPTSSRQRAISAWAILRLHLQVITKFKMCIRSNAHNPYPSVADTQSVSDSGYHSDKAAEEKRLEALELETKPYVISYEPVQPTATCDEIPSKIDPLDPLGALSSAETPKTPSTPKLSSNYMPMSPSRAKFMAELESTPFANEFNIKSESKTPNKSLGWLKGITNSPIMKMIRSQTFDPEAQGMSVSPSLHAIVNQVWKGYDDVRMDAVSSKLKLGVSSLVREVKSLNRSYRERGSGTIFGDDSDDDTVDIDEEDNAYQLDCGKADSILNDDWWLKEVYLQLRRNELRKLERDEAREETFRSGIVDVTLSSCTPCPNCRMMIYDEEIMSGWKVDDQNLNTVCPYCFPEDEGKPGTERNGIFAPRLTVHIERRNKPTTSWYRLNTFDADLQQGTPASTPGAAEDICVSYVSPLVLRREVETLLAADLYALKDPQIMTSHPVVFWNLVFYLRRLSLPSHLYMWISPRAHVRCVYDRPLDHVGPTPLYLVNPNHKFVSQEKLSRSLPVWKTVTQSVQDNRLFTAIQTLINDSRRVTENGQIALGPHFPVFRDIQFASLDVFGRALLRDSLDKQYIEEYHKLPPRIMCIMPHQDRPQSPVERACRKVFLPLDLF
uniref:C-myc promoter-binding protein n=1 Tax=Haemonchus contortus TaxID=6289 RepID=A0A7I4YM87_HAECO